MKPALDLTHRLVLSFEAPISTVGGCVRIAHSAAPRAVAIMAGGLVLAVFPFAGWWFTRSLAPLSYQGAALHVVIALIGVAVCVWGLNQTRGRWQLTFVNDEVVEYKRADRAPMQMSRKAMRFQMGPCWVSRRTGPWRGWLLTVKWDGREIALCINKNKEPVRAYADRLQALTAVNIHESTEIRQEQEPIS